MRLEVNRPPHGVTPVGDDGLAHIAGLLLPQHLHLEGMQVGDAEMSHFASLLLEALDDSIFASLEDAYGPAVDVPARLRRIAFGSLDEARAAISDLAAGIFHQGTYYPAAAATVPFLVEIAALETTARADVLLLLGEMSGAAEPDPPFDPYLFYSTPSSPDYPEAVATISAIRAGRPTYLAALATGPAPVRRAAAWLLARVGGADLAAPLHAALASADDVATRATLCLALTRLGAALPAPVGPGLDADVHAILQGGPLVAENAAAFHRLLISHAQTGELPGEWSDLVGLAVQALARFDDHPRAFDLVERALTDRLARGEAIRLPGGGGPERISSPERSLPWDPASLLADSPLRTLANELARRAFGARGEGPRLLRREELDERMRRLLALTVEHRIPLRLPAVPWIEPAHMARFLAGGGPLDREITLGDTCAPVYEHLVPVAQRPREPACAAALDAVFAMAAADWTAEESFDLVADLLAAPYGLLSGGLFPDLVEAAAWRHLAGKLEPQNARFLSYAENLVAQSSPTPRQACFALHHAMTQRRPPEPRFDSLVRAALPGCLANDVARTWLGVFPEPRRSAILVRRANAFLVDRLRDACDPETLACAILQGFLAPDCDWLVLDAEKLLALMDTEDLVRARAGASGCRARLIGSVLRTRTGEGCCVLDLRVEGDSVRAVLTDWQGTTRYFGRWSAQPKPDEVALAVATIGDWDEVRVDLAGDLDDTTRYRVFRLLGEVGFRGEIVDGGCTQRRG